MGLRVGNLIDLPQGTSPRGTFPGPILLLYFKLQHTVQYPKIKEGHENTNDVQTHTQKHKYFYMLFVYTQMSLDGGVKPHERCFNTVRTQLTKNTRDMGPSDPHRARQKSLSGADSFLF